MRAYTLCRLFGWSESEYLDSSAEFCDQVLAIRQLEMAREASHGS